MSYLLGGFSPDGEGILPKAVVMTSLYLFVGLIPLGFSIAFIVVGHSLDKERRRRKVKSATLTYPDAFTLPTQIMHGYKVALITDRRPTFTGLTGDTYLADAAATCNVNTEHIPPVADCECGFYAYKEFKDAQFELSINPGAFLLDVDLFGIGVAYQGGYRAESQVVNRLIAPKRCMRCHLLPAKVFVASYKLGYGSSAWWQWHMRCEMCARSSRPEERLSIGQMSDQLAVTILHGVEARAI
jgi:hypothetical protein